MSWSVVTTMNESEAVAARFVAYYLSLGAERVHLYFDGDAELAPKFSHEKFDLTICDSAYWTREIGKNARPQHQEIVQSNNANHAYAKRSAEWLLHVDADEYLAPLGRAIEEVLSEISHDLVWVRSFEPLASDGDCQLFYRPQRRADLARHVDPRYRKSLLLEHDIGKSFIRQGLDDVNVKIHSARIPDKETRVTECAEFGLLHYLNFGARAWAEKYAQRIANDRLHKFGLKPEQITRDNKSIAFYFEILDCFEAHGIDGLVKLFQGAKFLTDDQIATIYPLAEFHEFDFDFGQAIQDHFGLNLGHMTANTILDWGHRPQQ